MKIGEDGFLDAAEIYTTQSGAVFAEPPTLLVMHYTASGGDALTDAKYFQSRDAKGASAHLILGREGKIFQSVQMYVEAHHAGRSIWRGRTRCNKFSLGIEIDNWGPLTYGEDREYRAWPGTVVKEDHVIQARHKNGGIHDAWETYPEVQLAVLDEVVATILEIIECRSRSELISYISTINKHQAVRLQQRYIFEKPVKERIVWR